MLRFRCYLGNPNTRAPGVAFLMTSLVPKKSYRFWEIYYDLTDDITATFGARRYDIVMGLKGSSNFANRDWGAGDLDWGRNVDEI